MDEQSEHQLMAALAEGARLRARIDELVNERSYPDPRKLELIRAALKAHDEAAAHHQSPQRERDA